MKLNEWATKLKRDIPAIFVSLQDNETPILAKVLGAITIAYALSPVDLIPDFVPVLGYLDDVIILPVLAALTIGLIPNHVLEKSKQHSEGMWEEGRPKNWYFAIPILLIWGMIILWILRAVRNM